MEIPNRVYFPINREKPIQKVRFEQLLRVAFFPSRGKKNFQYFFPEKRRSNDYKTIILFFYPLASGRKQFPESLTRIFEEKDLHPPPPFLKKLNTFRNITFL
jgi:hypothetical protein